MVKTIIVFLIWPASHIFVIGAIFCVLFVAARIVKSWYPGIRSLPFLVIGAMWLCFWYYEITFGAAARMQGQNIRIDLALIVPLLFGVTILLTAFSVWNLIRAIGRHHEQI